MYCPENDCIYCMFYLMALDCAKCNSSTVITTFAIHIDENVGQYALMQFYIIRNVSITKTVLIYYNDLLFHNVTESTFCNFALLLLLFFCSRFSLTHNIISFGNQCNLVLKLTLLDINLCLACILMNREVPMKAQMK